VQSLRGSIMASCLSSWTITQELTSSHTERHCEHWWLKSSRAFPIMIPLWM
jgi:hypothetical protein